MPHKSFLVLCLSLISTVASAEPVFTNRTATLGIIHEYTGGWEHFVGGGVATFDCDGDQFPEVFLAGGSGPSTLLRNHTNNYGFDVILVPNTPESLNLGDVIGTYPLDINNDGHLDLFVLRVGENQLLQGGPDCTFSPNFKDITIDGGNEWTTAFSATWENNNALPTLAIGNYVDRDDPDGPFMACDDNFLLRPKNGQYQATKLTPAHCPLSMLFTDWGRTGTQDLRISNDRHYYVRSGSEQMWAMGATPHLYTEADGWKNYSLWGMGIASRDITGDGLPEVFLSSMGDQKLQFPDMPNNRPTYNDAPFTQGATAQRPYMGGDGRPSTGWQISFGDVDNDGRDDVFIAKGNVEQMPDSAMADPNNLLMQALDGTFNEHGMDAGIATMERSRGGALVDLNLDGSLDLVVVNRNAPAEVYQNETQSGSWLLLDVVQPAPNTRAIGGWIEITDGKKTWYRELVIGGGHASGNAALTHFGLGQSKDVQLRMIWPDGQTSEWINIQTNQILRIQRVEKTLAVIPL